MKILGIDLGTTTISAVVTDKKTGKTASAGPLKTILFYPADKTGKSCRIRRKSWKRQWI